MLPLHTEHTKLQQTYCELCLYIPLLSPFPASTGQSCSEELESAKALCSLFPPNVTFKYKYTANGTSKSLNKCPACSALLVPKHVNKNLKWKLLIKHLNCAKKNIWRSLNQDLAIENQLCFKTAQFLSPAMNYLWIETNMVTFTAQMLTLPDISNK